MGVGRGVEVAVAVAVAVGLGGGVTVTVGVGVCVGVGVGIGGELGVTVGLGGMVAVAVAVAVGVAVGVAVAVAVAVGVAVAVAVAVGVGDGVGTPPGACTSTPMGDPILKKPTVAAVGLGGWSASNRKLYSVAKRIALAFGLVANVSVLQVIKFGSLVLTSHGVLLYPASPTVPSCAKPGC